MFIPTYNEKIFLLFYVMYLVCARFPFSMPENNISWKYDFINQKKLIQNEFYVHRVLNRVHEMTDYNNFYDLMSSLIFVKRKNNFFHCSDIFFCNRCLLRIEKGIMLEAEKYLINI